MNKYCYFLKCLLTFPCLFVFAEPQNSISNETEVVDEKILLRTFAGASGNKEYGIDRDNVELDRDLAIVCDRMKTLDANLTKIYEEIPKAGGDEMMRKLLMYNQACLDLMYLCNIDKLKVLDAAQDILEPGGPKMFDIKVDDKILEERFKWDEDKIDEFHSVLKKTYEHWNDLWFLNNNFPSYLPT